MAIALDARDIASDAGNKIDRHEAVCAERYAGIRQDVVELKSWLKWGLISLIAALAEIAWSLAKH